MVSLKGVIYILAKEKCQDHFTVMKIVMHISMFIIQVSYCFVQNLIAGSLL
jgi:hypothetical protein